MATYINRQTNAFLHEIPLSRKRSDGRMKAYPSATDTRAWHGDREPRRQYINDLNRRRTIKDFMLGRYVPIEAIINALLASKNAEIAKLEEELAKYRSGAGGEKAKPVEKKKKAPAKKPAAKVDDKAAAKKAAEEAAAAKKAAEDEAARKAAEEAARKAAEEAARKAAEEAAAKAAAEEAARKAAEEAAAAESEAAKTPDDVDAAKAAEEAAAAKAAEEAAAAKAAEEAAAAKAAEEAAKQAEAAKAAEDAVKSDEDDTAAQEAAARAKAAEEAAAAKAAAEAAAAKAAEEAAAAKAAEEAAEPRDDFAATAATEAAAAKAAREAAAAAAREAAAAAAIPTREVELEEGAIDPVQACLEEAELTASAIQQLENIRSIADGQGDRRKELQAKEAPVTFANIDRILDNYADRLDKLKELDKDIAALKAKADQADALRGELDLMKVGSNMEVLGAKSDCEAMQRELDDMRAERDMLRRQLDDRENEVNDLKSKADDAERLKQERDALKEQLNEAASDDVLEKLRSYDALADERDELREKYEQLLGIECEYDLLRLQLQDAKASLVENDEMRRRACELECCVADQEEEIQRLVAHIDSLASGRDEHQARTAEALCCMRCELEQKDKLIAESEERLETVQTRLRDTIERVSYETATLKTRIHELEKEVTSSNTIVLSKQKHIDFLTNCLKEKERVICCLESDRTASKELAKTEYDAINLMRKELDAARAENERLQAIAAKMGSLVGDAHAENILKQSKCAVMKLNEELVKQFGGKNKKSNDLFGDQIKDVLKQSKCAVMRVSEYLSTK